MRASHTRPRLCLSVPCQSPDKMKHRFSGLSVSVMEGGVMWVGRPWCGAECFWQFIGEHWPTDSIFSLGEVRVLSWGSVCSVPIRVKSKKLQLQNDFCLVRVRVG